MIKLIANVLAVILILAVGLAVFMPLDCKLGKSESDLLAIGQALDLFKLDFGRYPTVTEGINALVVAPSSVDTSKYPDGGYLSRIPKDQWNNQYHYYLYNSSAGAECVEIWTYGADMVLGGDDDNEDKRISVNRDVCSN